MKVKIVTAIITVSTFAANAGNVYNTGLNKYGNDFNTSTSLDHRSQRLDLYNNQTGNVRSADLTPNSFGGYRGSGFDYQTGRGFDVDVDRFGNVDVFNY